MSDAVAVSRTDAAWRALADVLDPEVPVLSVLDLGIVRDVIEAGDGALEVTLTPTYSGCPATEAIEAAVLAALQPLGPLRIKTRWAPAWTTDWISEEGKRKLREYGIAPPGHLVGEATIRIVRRVGGEEQVRDKVGLEEPLLAGDILIVPKSFF